MADSTRYVGVRRPRIDSREKVLGATRYTDDLRRPGLLHARIVPGIEAHALIRGIDASAATTIPGVVAVLTANDLPTAWRGPERRFEPLAKDEVVFAGQPVALVVAETSAAAEDAAELVFVDLEPLDAAIDVAAAAQLAAPLARTIPVGDGRAVGAESRSKDADESADDAAGGTSNVFARIHERRGDVEAAFARCAVIVGGRFHVPWAHQAPVETNVATAWIEPDGTLVVSASTQGTFFARDELARLYGLPSSRVRVVAPPLGGAFGAKQVVVEPIVAGAALVLRSPVRLVLDRREDFLAANPSQAIDLDVRIGAADDGRLQALEATITYDAGAYTENSWEWFAHRLVTGAYRWEAFDVRGIGVRTNRFGAGNYRAPSGPQGNFALESLVDELAARLAIDPIEFRALNLVVEGDPMADGTPWPAIGAEACLRRMREHPTWTGRAGLPAGEGIGVALAIYAGSMQPAAATCRLEPDGTLTVITGVVDISGSTTGLAVIAAEALGVPVERVTVVTADTSTAPPTPPTNASAITYACGPAVRQAAAEVRARVLDIASAELEIGVDDLDIVDEIVGPRGSPGVGRSLAALAEDVSRSFDGRWPPLEGHAATAHSVLAPGASGHLAHVRVDEETGAVELLRYVVVQDVGRALDPALVEGQMMGGTAQSIGRALYEELVHDERGQLLTATLLDYAVPRASMVPPIETVIVEVPAPEGPFGAKGVGEASIVPGPAAIANAIAAATGVRLRDLPMTAPRVWAALEGGLATVPQP
jgi:CO/xanthine dehydrogenase Mo-binding subunit